MSSRRAHRSKASKRAKSLSRPAAKARRQQRRARRPGPLFEALVALQARLRAPNGCPWDREQTHASLRTYLVEETYEVLDALESADDQQLAGELGDLLLQIVFHAQLAREQGRFDIADVIERIHGKMVRRHPHVFGNARAKTSAQVLKNWEQLKADERRAENPDAAEQGTSSGGASLLDGVPRTLPAVLEAYQLTRRAARIGFDWDDLDGLLGKIKEETAELREALRDASSRREEEVGDLLFVAVNIARFLDSDPEIALRKANRKFTQRFKQMEQQAAQSGRRLADLSKNELEALWMAAKDKAAARAETVAGSTQK